MARSRYTITNLRSDLEKLNSYLEEAGSLLRIEENGRNGYQAVDEYEIDESGERPNSCRRMVCGGTSRECYDAAYDWYQGVIRRIERDELAALRKENQRLKEVVAMKKKL